MTQRPYVLAFDMDGVLFDTESVKLAAFLDAFVPFCGGDDAVVEKIQAYNAAHRGIPRAEKIRFVLTDLLGRPMHGDGGDADNVAARYAAFLAQRLPHCAPMDGLMEFLAEVDAIRYVVSSAPPPEIRASLERHGLDAAFHGVAGYPQAKTDALREIAERHHPVPVLYFGDAPADLAAARAAGTRFAAVNPNPGLAAIVDGHFDDFTQVDRQCVDRLVRTTAVNDPPRIRIPI